MGLLKGIVLLLPSFAMAVASNFTYNNKQFLLDGKPFVIIGGQMDPQRIHSAFWEDRLMKAKAMGLNTVFLYTFWNLLEPRQGQWLGSSPENNISHFASLANSHGLKLVLRLGPYVCGEREWGGLPWWLGTVPGIDIRKNNKPFFETSRRYLSKLGSDLKDQLVTRGGPILKVQVENEYGSFGNESDYKIALRDILTESFNVLLYTTDSHGPLYVSQGYIPGVLAEVDDAPKTAFDSRNRDVPDRTSLGPLLDGEYYTTYADLWGDEHASVDNDPAKLKQFADDTNFILSANNTISYHMYHGGTNFGFSSGAIWQGRTAPWTTSYDYGSPVDESGRIGELYWKLRAEISKFVPKSSIPTPPGTYLCYPFPALTVICVR
ncbi:hypothetical protein NLG97_g4859 [Lecanicillium saksenae]|uniref:Uncharacterized protein n=1 Tax=Lecanicillium saksenae TaxID=468837 RepID=A0ACC1QVZ3_9HYPO|nr:hypothetical protein NLG97_g4859 [Lecanicillium saksenae]